MADFQAVMGAWKRMCFANDDCYDGCPLADERTYGFEDCLRKGMNNPEKVQAVIEAWEEGHPEPKYPTIKEYLWEQFKKHGVASLTEIGFMIWMESTEIPADIAEKLDIKPKEESNGEDERT